MNSRYPDATPEEVEREGVCIICREEMRAWTEGGAAGEGGRAAGTQDQRSRPKKLPCGHVLHFACLRSWLERQQRCPTCRRPVLDEPLNGAGAPNAGGQAQPNAAGGAGLAFGAQLGPLGFDIGVGGPGFVQNLMDRMNQQQRPQQQQQQQGQQPQGQPPMQPQNQGAPGAGGAGGMAADIAQHIVRTRQLLDRELAMLEITQRQLRQLQELQAQAQAQAGGVGAPPAAGAGLPGQQVPATPLAPGAVPPAANPLLNLGGNFGARLPGMSIYHGGPVLNGANATAVLPQGMVLPPGWNVVPLTVPGATPAALPVTTPGGTMSLRSAESLRSRRGQQVYRERMMDHHSRLTPREESALRPSRPGLSRATTAPSGSSRPQPLWRAQAETTGGPVTGGDPLERLSQEQIETLSPTAQRSVATLSRFLQWQLDSVNSTRAYEILSGLPEETRDEILQGWPNRDQVGRLETGIGNVVSFGSEMDTMSAALTVAGWIEELPRDERIRVVLGFPEGNFRSFVCVNLRDHNDRREIARLSAALRSLEDETTESPTVSQSGISSMIESISDWTQILPLDETSSREDVERTDRETREIVNRRVQVLNDISRVMRNAAGQLEQVSGVESSSSSLSTITSSTDPSRLPTHFNTENPLSLFGQRSIFDSRAQEEALNALEREVIQKEREWRSRRGIAAVEGLLGATESKGKGKARADDEVEKSEEGGALETSEEKGKAPVKVTVEDVGE